MFQLVITFKDAGEFKNFRVAFKEMCTILRDNFPDPISQEILDTSWILDGNASISELNTFNYDQAFIRAIEERIILPDENPLAKKVKY